MWSRRRSEGEGEPRPSAAAPVALPVPAAPLPTPALPPPLAWRPDDEADAAIARAVERSRRRVSAQRDDLAAIVDSSFDAFVAIDADLRVVHWNARAERLFGWTRDEALGEQLLGQVLGPLSPTDLWTLASGAAGDEPLGLEAHHRRGRRLAVEVALSTSVAADGERRLQAFIRDVSKRRRAEMRAKLEHAVTRAVAENRTTEDAARQVLVSLADLFGCCAGAVWLVSETPGELRLLDSWTAGAPELRAWSTACAAGPLPLVGTLPGRACETATPVLRTEAPCLPGDPRLSCADAAGLQAGLCMPLVVDDEVVGVLELCDAVVRQVEPELIEHLRGAEQIFSNFLARRKAEAAAEVAQQEFLALVSHELRTPLTSILGYVQMLKGALPEEGAERAQRCTDVVARNTERLQRLVGDLLFAAEVGRGEMGLRTEPLNVRDLAGQALEAAWPAASERGVRLAIRIDADPPTVQGDPQRLGQVLDNLLTNAIKFSHDGGRVTLSVGVAGASEVLVAVEDEGIGVPADELGRLAERFYRASSARTAQVQGLGLGLALSSAIVDEHGGRLEIDSVEGEGTTVTVRLPVAVAESL